VAEFLTVVVAYFVQLGQLLLYQAKASKRLQIFRPCYGSLVKASL